jgi:hypothetical protein
MQEHYSGVLLVQHQHKANWNTNNGVKKYFTSHLNKKAAPSKPSNLF